MQKDPTNEAIEEQDGEGVRNVVENSEAVAVFICESLSQSYQTFSFLKQSFFFCFFY